MSEINIYKSGNTLNATMFNSYKNKYEVFFDDEVIDILDIIKKDINKIKNIFYSGDDLHFDLLGVEVSLYNIEKMKKDKNFQFIFKYIEDKKHKLLKSRLTKISAVGLAMLISTIGIVSVNAANNSDLIDEPYKLPETTYSDDSAISVNLDNTDYEAEETSVENDSLKETEKTESNNEDNDNKEQLNEESLSSSVSEELNVGSMSDSDKLKYVKDNYGSIIEKYADMYGLDANLVAAIATQERGEHSRVVDAGGAIGLMQVQVSVWDGHSVSAYNYDLGEKETIEISLDKLKDVDFNIKIGCMILQSYLKQMNDNTAAAIQAYNMGPGSMKKIISNYASATGKTYEDVINNPDDIGWTDYVNSSYQGDVDYLEHVVRYYENNNNIKK